jgi:DNA-binding Lrp family transcriptional regulator
MPLANLNPFERRLLNDFQQDMPLSPTPFADMAAQLGVTEAEVLEALAILRDEDVVSRVGPVLAIHRVGASTLAAMAVPESRLEAVARRVSDHPAVNHNYEREHRFNLWFVATAASEAKLAEVITELEQATGLDALVLPMIEDYHIDLGFELQWN